MEEQQKYSMKDFQFWKITFSLAFASFFVFASMYVVQPLLPLFVSEFNISVSESTLALSMTIVGLIIGLVILGFFSDRVGRTFFIKISLIGSVIPFFLIPIADSFYLIVLLRFIQGFALAGLPAASLAYLNEEIDRRSVGVATALYISSNALGGMAGRVVTGYVTDHYSWETAFYVFAVIGLLILVVVLFLLPKSNFFEASKLPFKKDIEGMAFHLKNPAILLVIGIGVVLQFSFTSIWTYLPFHLEAEPFSLSLESISYTFFAYGLGVIGAPLGGWLAARLGLKKVRISGMIVLSLGAFITFSLSVTIIIIGLCVLCLGFFTAHALTAASVTEQATHHKGSASSLYLVAYYIGVTLGSSAVGPIWDSAGWNGIVLFAGLLPLVYLAFVILMQKRLRKKSI
ncbi:MFS transporter [Oceanobacillus saliphilus]|uniref:MFS transporter n=1 Tax=Oceanobacillus saliphilus TaxID=2925834 RepID=UPI00201DCBA4|nr:MFS transporter [Oceanobacillus saliphilus]